MLIEYSIMMNCCETIDQYIQGLRSTTTAVIIEHTDSDGRGLLCNTINVSNYSTCM